MGGLGNQLFQLAGGIEIANVSGKLVKFSTDLLDLPATAGTTKRHLGILELLRPTEVIDRNFVSGIARLGSIRFGKRSIRLVEESLQEDVTKRVVDTTRYVQGYFQNWEIVERSWPELEKRFQNSVSFSQIISNPVEERIAVHMRYGDYRTNHQARAFHGLTDPSYFVESISLALEKGEKPEVLILSDEPDYAFKELSAAGLNNELNIEFGNSKDQLGDLALMASSTTVVTSNSSFSWWGSWIASQRSSAKVFMPTPWFSSSNVMDPALYFDEVNVLIRRVIK
jgi:hypothetical protein